MHYSWFATTWQGGHVGGQNKRNFSRRICMKIEFCSQRREMLLFLTTNMATVTSRANQQFPYYSHSIFLSSYVPHFEQRHFSHNQATFSQWVGNKHTWTWRNFQKQQSQWTLGTVSGWHAEARFHALARFCQTPPPSGYCVTSNLLLFPTHRKGNTVQCPRDASPTTLGFNIDWCIKLLWGQFTQFPNPNHQTSEPFDIRRSVKYPFRTRPIFGYRWATEGAAGVFSL